MPKNETNNVTRRATREVTAGRMEAIKELYMSGLGAEEVSERLNIPRGTVNHYVWQMQLKHDVRKTRVSKGPRQFVDPEKMKKEVKELYDLGMIDTEIAERLAVNVATVKKYRTILGLKAHWRRLGQANTARFVERKTYQWIALKNGWREEDKIIARRIVEAIEFMLAEGKPNEAVVKYVEYDKTKGKE